MIRAGMALLLERKGLLFLRVAHRRTAAWQRPRSVGECGGEGGVGGRPGGQGSRTPTHTCGS